MPNNLTSHVFIHYCLSVSRPPLKTVTLCQQILQSTFFILVTLGGFKRGVKIRVTENWILPFTMYTLHNFQNEKKLSLLFADFLLCYEPSFIKFDNPMKLSSGENTGHIKK